jgi:hypothetical protein
LLKGEKLKFKFIQKEFMILSTDISYVYVLIDPITGFIRYVGQTQDAYHRIFSHITDAKNRDKTHRGSWIKSLLNKGLKPILEVIQCASLEEIDFWECHYISLYKSWGFDLTNYELGGNKNKKYSLEHRKRLSEIHTGTFTGIDSHNAKPFAQFSKGILIGVFGTIKEAHELTGIGKCTISRYLNKDSRPSKGSGYHWEYISKEFYFENKDRFTRYYVSTSYAKGRKISASRENFYKEYNTITECALDLKVPTGNINKVIRGERPHAGGYTFKHLN